MRDDVSSAYVRRRPDSDVSIIDLARGTLVAHARQVVVDRSIEDNPFAKAARR